MSNTVVCFKQFLEKKYIFNFLFIFIDLSKYVMTFKIFHKFKADEVVKLPMNINGTGVHPYISFVL